METLLEFGVGPHQCGRGKLGEMNDQQEGRGMGLENLPGIPSWTPFCATILVGGWLVHCKILKLVFKID